MGRSKLGEGIDGKPGVEGCTKVAWVEGLKDRNAIFSEHANN
jgi:hypothetical protein